MAHLVQATLRGIVWNYASYYGGRVLVFISTVILARLLSKEDMGVAGYAIIVISFLDVLNELGIGASLIYHKESDEATDTAFWLGIGVSITIYVVTWVGAPLIGLFFQDERAIAVTRGLALTFPLTALGSVQYALLQKGLAFGRKAVPDMGRALGRGILAIMLAFAGFGAWSLIIGQLAGVVVWVVILWGMLPWRPSLRFSLPIARSILSYGVGSMLVDALAVIHVNADYLFVGRFLGAIALGIYTIAYRIPEMIIIQFCVLIARVIFPAYTKMRDNPDAFRQGFLATTRYVALVTMPLGIGIMLVAEPFVLTIFTAKWAEVIPVMRLLALSSMLFSLSFHAGDIYKAQGRLAILNWITLFQIVVTVPGMYWAVVSQQSIVAVAVVHVVVSLCTSIIDFSVACYFTGTRVQTIPIVLRPAVVGSISMALVVYAMLLLLAPLPTLVQLLGCIVAGIGAYAAALWLIERATVMEAWHTLTSLRHTKNRV